MKTPTLPTTSIILMLALLAGGCRAETEPTQIGRLIVRSEPMINARVFLNGVEQDQKTNADFPELRVGRYLVRLEKAASGTTGAPHVGEAEVMVRANRARRVTIRMNRMAIIPPMDTTIRPKTKGQKSIVDFYTAIADGEIDFAYGFLNLDGQRDVGGSRLFQNTWGGTTAIEILNLEIETSTPDPPQESHRVGIDIKMTTETIGQNLLGPTATAKERREYILTTVPNSDGFGLPKISAIVATTPTIEPQGSSAE